MRKIALLLLIKLLILNALIMSCSQAPSPETLPPTPADTPQPLPSATAETPPAEAPQPEPPPQITTPQQSEIHPAEILLTESTPDVEKLLAKGIVALMFTNYKEAIECFNQAVELDPHNAVPYRYLGIT